MSSIKDLQKQLSVQSEQEQVVQREQPSLGTNLARTGLGQGLLFGFGDELEASVRAAFDKSKSYDDFITEIRTDIDKFRETNPGLAYGSEIAGAIPGALTGTGLLARAGIKGVGKAAAIEGGVYGAGAADGDVIDRTVGAGTGAAISGPVAKVASKVLPKITPKAKELQDKGVRLTLGQQIGGEGGTIFGNLLENVEKMSTSIPAVGQAVAKRRVEAIVDFNRLALDEAIQPLNISVPKGLSGREAFDFVDDEISKAYTKVLDDLTITSPSAIEEAILKTVVNSDLDEPAQNALLKQMQKKIFDKFKTDSKIDGQFIKNIETELGRLERSYRPKGGFEGELGIEYGKIKNAFLDEVANQNNGAIALKNVNKAYANLIPIKEAMASAIAREGVFTPAQLLRGIRKTDKSKFKTRSSKGNLPLQKTAELANEVVGNAFPDSGTASRIITGNIVTDATEAIPFIAPGLLSSAMYSPVGRPLTNAIIRAPEFLTRTTVPAVSSITTNPQETIEYLNQILNIE